MRQVRIICDSQWKSINLDVEQEVSDEKCHTEPSRYKFHIAEIPGKHISSIDAYKYHSITSQHTSSGPSVGKDIYFMEIVTHEKKSARLYAKTTTRTNRMFVDRNARILRRRFSRLFLRPVLMALSSPRKAARANTIAMLFGEVCFMHIKAKSIKTTLKLV